MGTWRVDFADNSIEFGRRLIFFKTTNIRGFKVMPFKWFLTFDKKLRQEPHYKLFENVRSILAPDGVELSDKLFVIFAERNRKAPTNLGDGYVISEEVSSKIDLIGYIVGLSTANEVGIFGLWPKSFYEISIKRPDIMIIPFLLISDKPIFWRKVQTASKPGLFDKLRV